MSYKCPNCEAEIESVDYEKSGYEYGSYNPTTGEENCHDTSFDGDCYYKCPECDEEIDPDDLEEWNEDDEEAECSDEHLAEIREPDIPNLFTKDDNDHYLKGITVCKHCGQGYEFQDEEKEAECSKCGNSLSKKSLFKTF